MKNFQGPLTALLVIISGTAHPANWQYAGYAKVAGGNAQLFFDTESVTRPDRNTVRFWIKSILTATLDQYDKKHEKRVTNDSAKKIATGYCPELLMLPAIEKIYTRQQFLDACVDATLYEVEANSPDITAVNKIYFEMDCRGKRYRTLEAILFDKHGNLSRSSRGESNEWSFIAPDSNTELWSSMLCGEAP